MDEALEAFLRGTVPLSATDVDVVFEAPDREWAAKLTRPTVNVFLWDIRRSTQRARSGIRTDTVDGKAVRRSAAPIIELRYVISAWTSDHGDERGLLGGVVRSLLAYEGLPRDYLPAALQHLEAPTLTMARAGEDHMDVFKALEGKVKPGVNMVLTTEFDTGLRLPVGPPVTSIGTAIGRMDGERDRRRRVAGEVVDAEERGAVGAVVRAPTDMTYVNPSGQFLIRAAEGDEITLEIEPEITTRVTATGGVRFE